MLEAATGAVVARLRLAGRHDTKALAYSPDGRWLAGVSTDDKTLCLFDAHTYQLMAQFPGHDGRISAVTFSLDSRRVASCGSDQTVRVWQIDGGACQVLRGHTEYVFAVAFHPDGTRLASAGRDRAVWLWDLARGEEVARLQGHTNYVWSLAFSPDGTTLASGSGDRTVRLWDTAPLRTRYQARHEAEALRPDAERLVNAVWRQKYDPAGVVDALRTDQALSEPLRQASLRRAAAGVATRSRPGQSHQSALIPTRISRQGSPLLAARRHTSQRALTAPQPRSCGIFSEKQDRDVEHVACPDDRYRPHFLAIHHITVASRPGGSAGNLHKRVGDRRRLIGDVRPKSNQKRVPKPCSRNGMIRGGAGKGRTPTDGDALAPGESESSSSRCAICSPWPSGL